MTADEPVDPSAMGGGAPHPDGKHAVFGEVTDGMDVVEAIGSADTDARDNLEKRITIETVEVHD